MDEVGVGTTGIVAFEQDGRKFAEGVVLEDGSTQVADGAEQQIVLLLFVLARARIEIGKGACHDAVAACALLKGREIILIHLDGQIDIAFLAGVVGEAGDVVERFLGSNLHDQLAIVLGTVGVLAGEGGVALHLGAIEKDLAPLIVIFDAQGVGQTVGANRRELGIGVVEETADGEDVRHADGTECEVLIVARMTREVEIAVDVVIGGVEIEGQVLVVKAHVAGKLLFRGEGKATDAFVDVADVCLLLRDDILLMLYQAVEGLVELLVGDACCKGIAKRKEREDDDQGDLFHGVWGLMENFAS